MSSFSAAKDSVEKSSQSNTFDLPTLTEGDENITIARSDGRKHDLTSAVSLASNFKDLVAIQQKESDQKKVQEKSDDHDHKDKKIEIRRSDGLSHDIIKVFKALSDPRGENFKIRQSGKATSDISAPKNRSASIMDGLRRSTLGKVDMQEILTSRGEKSLPPSTYTYHPNSVRIIHMSDTHNLLIRNSAFNNSFLPSGDILIHSGNFTDTGTDEEYAQFNAWLGSLANTYHYRVVVAGNRDVKQLGNDWDAIRLRLSNATHVLCHNEATILGIRIYGCPWHWGHEANYTLKPGAPDSSRFGDIPENINILVTHGPAYGRLDAVVLGDVAVPKSGRVGHTLLREDHWGSQDLAEALQRTKPALHLHGHVRGARGFLVAFGNHPLSVNSAMCGRDSKVLYACPHVVKGSHIFTDDSAAASDSHSSKMWEFNIDSLVAP